MDAKARTAEDPERARRLEALFAEASSLPEPERAEFVARRSGGDRELASRLSELLAADGHDTHGALEGDAVHGAPAKAERIGRYRLVRILGEGGMGTVWLAEQEEPVRRLVALKTIRLGAFDSGAAARFAAECQALAVMDHPGIAKVFDGGVTAHGMPYFVMEYAPGLPLTDHCARYRLALDERVELLAKVCDAVEHAHQKGVVHRDLKPGNVLIDTRAGAPLPRIVDFGLARALTGPLTHAQATVVDGFGTPAYASPERLGGVDPGVDTREDVYSLGVMLFELLSGRLPHQARNRAELARELSRDPPAPSAALRAAGADAEEIARERATTPNRLARRLRGELDAIALRALARDRTHRTGSAAALAEDLRRTLRHEPVSALPPRAGHLTRLFLRRHRLGAVAVLAVLLALVLGLAGTLSGLRHARAAEGEARAAEREAQRRGAAEHEERAEADLLVRAFQQALLLAQANESGGTALTVAELLEVLAEDVEALGKRGPGPEAALHSALGRAFLALGADEQALREYLRAGAVADLEQDPLDRFEILTGLIEASRRLGDFDGARVYVSRALAAARAVFAGRDAGFSRAFETQLQLASGTDVDGERALADLDVVLAALPDSIVRGDESGVTARVLIEAAVTLQRHHSPAAPAFLRALEEHASARLPREDLRLTTFLWSLLHARLLPDCVVGEDTERAAGELVALADARLPPGHWLRSDARRMLGTTFLERGAHGASERQLLAALEEVGSSPSAARRRELAESELDRLAGAVAGLEPEPRDAFVAVSFETCVARGEGVWWLATRPALPAPLRESAVRLLAGRNEPPARLARGMLQARAGHWAEAITELADARGTPAEPPLAVAFRALALAHLGRADEARAEIVRVEGGPAAAKGLGGDVDALLRSAREFLR